MTPDQIRLKLKASAQPAFGHSDFDLLGLKPAEQELRPAAVLVPIIDRPDGATILLTRRTAHLRAHAGQDTAKPDSAADSADSIDMDMNSAGEITGYPATPFYRQLLPADTDNRQSSAPNLLQQVTASDAMFDAFPTDREQDNDLAFNYLWMQQYQHGYEQKNGGAAVGRLLRMGVKSIYNAYTGTTPSSTESREDFTRSTADLDYRLRLSQDKVKFGIKYEF